jgi:hypothetical protein
MEVRVTVTDPKAYTHPFTVTINEYLEPAGELMDFVCLENDSSGPQFLGKYRCTALIVLRRGGPSGPPTVDALGAHSLAAPVRERGKTLASARRHSLVSEDAPFDARRSAPLKPPPRFFV